MNSNFPEEEFDDTISRKIYADLYIDDRNIGGLLDWTDMYRMISTKKPDPSTESGSKNRFMGFLDKIFRD